MTHNFNIHHAKKYGLVEAVLLNIICLRMAQPFKPLTAESRLYMSDFAETWMPYVSEDERKTAILRLIEQGAISVKWTHDGSGIISVVDENLFS